MGGEMPRRRSSKIARLPPEVRREVDDRIADSPITFQETSDWLKEQGFDISHGAVGRYAICMGKAAQRVADNLEQTKLILERIERNPEIDPAKAAQAVMMDGLMRRMSTAEDDFMELPLDKAGRLLASFRRVGVAERKLTFDMRGKLDLAFEELEHQLMDAIKNDPALSVQLREILTKAKEKMIADE